MSNYSVHHRPRLLAGCAAATLLALAGCSSPTGTAPAPTAAGVASSPASRAASTTPTGPTSVGAASAPFTVPTPVKVKGRDIQYHGQRDVRGDTATTIQLEDFYFSPSVLIGSPNQTLQVTLRNTGQAPHTFTLDGGGADVVVPNGKTMTVSITFPASGQQPFVCRFHIGAGMAGELAVAPA